MAYLELEPRQAEQLYAGGTAVLDVRTDREWTSGHIPGAVHIPLDELEQRYDELDPGAEILVVCAHGIRSAAAGQWLSRLGFQRVINLRHGMSRWTGPVEYGTAQRG